ncbi:unnamed protein product [Ostreobium quekettii]|uniref:Calcineurin-like phosphoesterase domain-containing protein n=1 Tax=Ostreobium quekettii TaxID=121088 RepID=A0A8S1IS87_9CHLO|nr:unnamed protein product [Ostreobium quekettii]
MAVLFLFAWLFAAPAFAKPQLAYGAQGVFKIVQFTDLHFGESPALDAQSVQLMRSILSSNDIDFAVLSGDMVSGYAYPRGTKPTGWYAARWKQLIAPLHEHQVKYAMILGNHDDEADLTRREIVELDMATGANLSYTCQGPTMITGATNYWLDIADNDHSDVSAGRLWFFDSMDMGCKGKDYSWGCVGADTVSWFSDEGSKLPHVPGLAFVHIPLCEHLSAWRYGTVVGSKFEPVCCPRFNTGLFLKLREQGVTSLYSGHDHDNSYSALHMGVRLAYGQKSGYGSYGPARSVPGARIIVMKKGEQTSLAETWIAFPNGAPYKQTTKQSSISAFQLRCAAGPHLPRRVFSSQALHRERSWLEQWSGPYPQLLSSGVVLLACGAMIILRSRRTRRDRSTARPVGRFRGE